MKITKNFLLFKNKLHNDKAYIIINAETKKTSYIENLSVKVIARLKELIKKKNNNFINFSPEFSKLNFI